MTISERITEILRKFVVFLLTLNRGKPRGKFGFVLNNTFCSNQKNGTNINKNCFSPQNEPHTAKLCFSVVCKHFGGNLLKNSLFSQKSDYLRKKLRIT